MEGSIHDEETYKRSKKKSEVGRIKKDLSKKLGEVEADPVLAARDYGLRELNPYAKDVSVMENSLDILPYYFTFPRKPSTDDIKKLDRSVVKAHKQYQTKSEEMAAAGEEKQVRDAKLAEKAAYYMGRKIKERYTPSPAFNHGNESLREGSSLSLSEVSIGESSHIREPTPQPVLAALPPPPRYHGSSSRGTVAPYGVYTEPTVASSSRYTSSPSWDAASQHRGHDHMNLFGQESNFSNEILEESEIISEESEHSVL